MTVAVIRRGITILFQELDRLHQVGAREARHWVAGSVVSIPQENVGLVPGKLFFARRAAHGWGR